MKRGLLIGFMVLAAAMPVTARLGETASQCIKRYGDAASSFDGGHVFYTDHFAVVAIFRKDVCIGLIYEKNEGRIFDDEKPAILKVNSAGQAWAEFNVPEEFFDRYLGKTFWRRQDGALAMFDPFNHQFHFFAPGFSNHLWKPKTSTGEL